MLSLSLASTIRVGSKSVAEFSLVKSTDVAV